MANNIKCSNCIRGIVVKNGFTNPDKYGRKKQKYLCTECRKTFVGKREALTKTEKRLFSLLYNLIHYEATKDDTLKQVACACNKEVNSIGKLDLEVTPDPVDLNSLSNIKVVICAKGEDIKIIKTCPEEVSINIKDYIRNKMDLSIYGL